MTPFMLGAHQFGCQAPLRVLITSLLSGRTTRRMSVPMWNAACTVKVAEAAVTAMEISAAGGVLSIGTSEGKHGPTSRKIVS